MKRVYYPFWQWEDIGMWRNADKGERDTFLSKAIAFTGDAKRYGAAMLEVLEAFPLATLHNLTDSGQNRRAWIGHAACYLALECPEDITREAWGKLTQQQQDEANAAADYAIEHWERNHAKDSGLHNQMEITGVFRGDSRSCPAKA